MTVSTWFGPTPPDRRVSSKRADILPSLGIAFGAALWGLYWIPVRGIEQAGVSAFWTGPVIFGASMVVFIPLILLRWRRFAAHWHHTLIPGLLAGFAFSLHIASLNLTDVVRAILLFYMSPLWSTLLGVMVLKERLTSNRMIALLLAFCGLYVVLVVESGLPIPRNTGDWFALASGLCWSVASVKLFQDGAQNLIEKVTIFVAFALLMSGTVIIENVFAIKGLGRVLIQSILNRDYPVVQGAILVVSVLFVFSNLVVDILYSVIDPRIRRR